MGDRGLQPYRCRDRVKTFSILTSIPLARLPGKGRNVVERAIIRLKDFRAAAMRYDKRGYHFLAAVMVATIILWHL